MSTKGKGASWTQCSLPSTPGDPSTTVAGAVFLHQHCCAHTHTHLHPPCSCPKNQVQILQVSVKWTLFGPCPIYHVTRLSGRPAGMRLLQNDTVSWGERHNFNIPGSSCKNRWKGPTVFSKPPPALSFTSRAEKPSQTSYSE